MFLQEIKDKLLEFDKNVYYGTLVIPEPGMLWDYIVYNRTSFSSSGQRTGYVDGFDVHIIREVCIPEGLPEQIIESLCSIPGVRLENKDGVYSYMEKPNTEHVVEMLTLSFVKARKKGVVILNV